MSLLLAEPEAARDASARAAMTRPAVPQPLLLVEDDPLIRDVLLETLTVRGYDVVDAATGEEAARLMAAGLRPPVLVTDINLGPGCTGVDLADQVRAENPDLPIVFITGRLDMLRDRGARCFEYILPKPFALTAFLDLVGRLATGN